MFNAYVYSHRTLKQCFRQFSLKHRLTYELPIFVICQLSTGCGYTPLTNQIPIQAK